jgi:hypothetical protein
MLNIHHFPDSKNNVDSPFTNTRSRDDSNTRSRDDSIHSIRFLFPSTTLSSAISQSIHVNNIPASVKDD